MHGLRSFFDLRFELTFAACPLTCAQHQRMQLADLRAPFQVCNPDMRMASQCCRFVYQHAVLGMDLGACFIQLQSMLWF